MNEGFVYSLNRIFKHQLLCCTSNFIYCHVHMLSISIYHEICLATVLKQCLWSKIKIFLILCFFFTGWHWQFNKFATIKIIGSKLISILYHLLQNWHDLAKMISWYWSCQRWLYGIKSRVYIFLISYYSWLCTKKKVI